MKFLSSCSLLMLLPLLSLGAETPRTFESLQEKYQIRISPSFSKNSKALIEEAFAHMPEELLPQLHGLFLRNAPTLRWKGRLKCLTGRQESTSPPQIALNAPCGFSAKTAFHEMFHIVGNKGLLDAYGPVFERYGRCPVSWYSDQYRGRSQSEDFAEASRLIFFPESGEKYEGACVDAKLAALRAIYEKRGIRAR